jgi:hypothetical protein
MPTPTENPDEQEKEVPKPLALSGPFASDLHLQIKPLDDDDIELLKTYGVGPYR